MLGAPRMVTVIVIASEAAISRSPGQLRYACLTLVQRVDHGDRRTTVSMRGCGRRHRPSAVALVDRAADTDADVLDNEKPARIESPVLRLRSVRPQYLRDSESCSPKEGPGCPLTSDQLLSREGVVSAR